MNNIRFSAVVMALVFLSFSAQAQFRQEPADFDRLLSAEFSERSQPTVSNCKTTGATNCAGVIYVQFSPEFSSATELVIRVEARAGQEPIGALGTLGICRDAVGNVIPNGAGSATFCTAFGGTDYTPAVAGNIDADNPANIFYNADVRVTYSKDIFSGADTIGGTGVCTSVNEFDSAQVSSNTPNEVDTSPSLGIVTYSYDSAFQGQSPTAIALDNVIQYQTDRDSYTSLIKLTCSISDVTQLWNMDYHVGMYRTLSQHVGANAQLVYIVSPENSLEFLPLDGTNYIAHAEITEGGDGVLIEYAQAVTDNTSQSYTMTTGDGLTDITPTISDTIWLNNQTVWLALGSSIYGNAGINNGSGTALDADRHVLVASTFPDDTSFGDNFAQTSTYRAVLTRHASDADLDGSAPTMMTVVALDYDSIELTFSDGDAVCGSPETGCAALTADHFEVVHYEGDISSTESATLLTISAVTLTGDSTNGYTVAVLDIDLDSAPEIDGDDYLLVRTARNSRFTDNFITDRTIFSQATTPRTILRTSPAETYTEAASGMLHLQSGALVEAIPVITYSLTNADGDSISEGGEEPSTATFTITRAPDGVKFETTVGITITRTSGDGPDNFSVTFDGIEVAGDGVWTEVITFAPEENVQMIEISYTGNDVGTADSVYTFELSLPGGARIADGSISIFTIEEDDNTAPVINLADVTINESDVELDDGNVRDFDDLNDYMTRGITQSSLLFSISDSVVTDDPATAATYTRVVVTLIGEGESNTAWTLTNGGDTNFGAPEETTPGKDLIYTYTPVSDITEITDVASLIGKIKIELNAAEFPRITDADGRRDIEVMLEVFEAQASGTDLIGSNTAQYTLIAQNDPVQYIRPEDSEDLTITGTLAGDDLVMTLVLEEIATTTGYTGNLGLFTDGSATADVTTEGSGGFLTFIPATVVSDLLTNQTFPTTDSTTIRASELGYSFGLVGGEFGTAARAVTVSDGDGSNNNEFTFTVEVTEAVLRFRIKVFLEGAQ